MEIEKKFLGGCLAMLKQVSFFVLFLFLLSSGPAFSRTSQARMAGQFDFFLSDCEQNMKRLSNVVFEASLAYSAQAAAMKKMAQLMLRAEK